MNNPANGQPFKPTYDELNDLISLLTRFTTDFVSGVDRSSILDRLLAGMLTLVDADYGFIAENNSVEDSEEIVLNLEALRKNNQTSSSEELESNIDIAPDSLIGNIFNSALPLISNETTDQTLGLKILPGNPSLVNYIAIPLHIRDQVIGIILLGNRPTGFDRGIAVHLAPIANSIAALMESGRNEEQAYYDPLTGLHNQKAFQQRYQVEASRHTRKRLPLSLLLIEVEHLNNYRNNYGIVAVDNCIKQIANTLAENLRTEDCVVRTNPDQFVALLTETPNVRAVMVAEKLRQAVASALKELATINPSLSIGLTTAVSEQKDFKIVLSNATKALEKALLNGGNQVQSEK